MFKSALEIDVWIHWLAVVLYVLAALFNTYGVIFRKEKAEKRGYFFAVCGLVVHGIALLYWWHIVGHGPYMDRYEVLSSDAWIVLFFFLISSKIFPKIKPASLVIFPFTFLMIALGLFFSPAVMKLPPTLRSVWLVFHVAFYKISLGTLLVALAFSVFYVLKKRKDYGWLERLPDLDAMDVYAYRFAGFGFTFWAVAMLAGAIWAYQSWGTFWDWDPIETWSLMVWVLFGIYLHLRRFFGWKGERSAYFFMLIFVVAIITIFFVPLVNSTLHTEYLR